LLSRTRTCTRPTSLGCELRMLEWLN